MVGKIMVVVLIIFVILNFCGFWDMFFRVVGMLNLLVEIMIMVN